MAVYEDAQDGVVARPSMSHQVVARHLVVLSSAMALIALSLASDVPVLLFALLVLPAGSVAAARVAIAPVATVELVRGYHWATFVSLALGLASSGGYIPGPASLVALGFVWMGWSRRSAVLGGVSFATLLAVAPLDVAGPLEIAPGMFGSFAHISAFAVVAMAVAVLAAKEFRRARVLDHANSTAPSAS